MIMIIKLDSHKILVKYMSMSCLSYLNRIRHYNHCWRNKDVIIGNIYGLLHIDASGLVDRQKISSEQTLIATYKIYGVRQRSGQAVLLFFLSDSILRLFYFYPTLPCWCNSLNKKAQKELYESRQQQRGNKDISFIFFLYFLGSTTIQWVREFSLNTIESPCQGV